jgi:hypothetical protein
MMRMSLVPQPPKQELSTGASAALIPALAPEMLTYSIAAGHSSEVRHINRLA